MANWDTCYFKTLKQKFEDICYTNSTHKIVINIQDLKLAPKDLQKQLIIK